MMRLKLAFMIIMSGLSGVAYSADCPSNFIDVLEGKADTSLYKKHIADLCLGHEVRVTGKVYDVDREGNGYHLRIDSIPGSNIFEIEMVNDPGADMLTIKKGDVVTVTAKLKKFAGYINDYIDLNEGVCVKCKSP